MGVGSLLKRALSGIQEFDRRAMYGPNYKEKAAALAQLNELNVKAKLLENQDKFERIQQMRAEFKTRTAQQENAQSGAAFGEGVKLGSSLDPTPISGFVSPTNPDASIDEVDPENVLHSPGEGMVEPELPSFIKSRIRPEDRGVLGAAIQAGRGRRRKAEQQQEQLFDANLGVKRLQDDATQALINQRNASGGGGRQKRVRSSTQGFQMGPDGKPVFGTNVVFDDEVVFRPYEGSSRPLYGTEPTQTDRNAIIGAGTSYSDLDKVISNFEKADAAGLLGPITGRFQEFNAKMLGGEGIAGFGRLSDDQRVLLQSIDRAKTLAAFAEGGKQLTGTEKEYFDTNYPRLSNTAGPKTFIRLARELQAAIRRGADKRRSLMSPQRQPTDQQMQDVFSTPGDSPALPPGWEIGPDGVMRRKQ